MKTIQLTTVALFSSLLMAPAFAQDCQDSQDVRPGKDIVDTAVAAGQFKTLAAALGAANLVPTLKGKGPFTVFAPTDAAFEKLPEGMVADLLKKKNLATLRSILTYHVVAGKLPTEKVIMQKGFVTLNGQRVGIQLDKKGAMIGGARILKTDIHCSNGVIHVIDTVMTPVQEDIVGVAKKSGSFKTLTAALQAAGLADTLRGKGPFTVFAPTDAAFEKLPEGTVESLLKPENKDKLVAILTYHVVPGRNFASKVTSTPSLDSVQGQPIEFTVTKGKAKANDATIVDTDINASNGVIHVIDKVIMPPSGT